MSDRWDPRACAAVDALRSGVVNQYVAERVTYGRDLEIDAMEGQIDQNPDGSCQVVIGPYGVGKSHLCEVVRDRLELKGYAVARLEMGASHGRAENPRSVLGSVRRAISLRLAGRRFCGETEIACLLLAAKRPQMYRWDYELLRSVHEEFPGEEALIERYEALRERYPMKATEAGIRRAEPELFGWVPSTMTAANLAVAEINEAAHALKMVGVPGVVLLLDEAERSNWAASSYQANRAWNLMMGLALGAANEDTRYLKHYYNRRWPHYIPSPPSRLHVLFWFSHEWGLANSICSSLESEPLYLGLLDTSAHRKIERGILRLYRDAYGGAFEPDEGSRKMIWEHAMEAETRSFVRRLVASLDQARSNGAHV
jgi:hypothetical protein